MCGSLVRPALSLGCCLGWWSLGPRPPSPLPHPALALRKPGTHPGLLSPLHRSAHVSDSRGFWLSDIPNLCPWLLVCFSTLSWASLLPTPKAAAASSQVPLPPLLLPPLTARTEARGTGLPCGPVHAPPAPNSCWPCGAVQTPAGHSSPPGSCPSHACGRLTSCLSSVSPHPSICMSVYPTVRPSTHPSIHPINSDSTSFCVFL